MNENKKLKTYVEIREIEAKRLWNKEENIPPVRIAVNLSFDSATRTDNVVKIECSLNVRYDPEVAYIMIKGLSLVIGDPREISNIVRDNIDKKPLPASIVDATSTTLLLEALLISRILNIPPCVPLPETVPKRKSWEPS